MPRERICHGHIAGRGGEATELRAAPQNFSQYIGQETLIHKIAIAVRAAKGATSRSSMFCCTGLQGWGRPRWLTSLPMKLEREST